MMQRDTPFLGSLTMNPRHNEIAPLNTSSVNSTRSPSPPSNGGGESGIRGRRGRPRRRLLPRLLPSPQIPLTPPPMGLRPMYQPFPFGSQPPMRPAPSWSPYNPPAPVSSHTVALAQLLFRNAHRGSSLMRPQSSADRMMIYPRPVEMPFGVMPNEGPRENESHGEAVSLTDYMDPDKIFNVYSEDDLEIVFGDSEKNVKSSSGGENSNLNVHESPNLPPSPGYHHGVTKWVDWNENALSDPKHGKRILANGESSASSNAKKVRRVQESEEEVSALEREYII